jgi:hypothetical protein
MLKDSVHHWSLKTRIWLMQRTTSRVLQCQRHVTGWNKYMNKPSAKQTPECGEVHKVNVGRVPTRRGVLIRWGGPQSE